jgi:hypothetical protein
VNYCWIGSSGGLIPLEPPGFAPVKVGDGYVAIANHNGDYVVGHMQEQHHGVFVAVDETERFYSNYAVLFLRNGYENWGPSTHR